MSLGSIAAGFVAAATGQASEVLIGDILIDIVASISKPKSAQVATHRIEGASDVAASSATHVNLQPRSVDMEFRLLPFELDPQALIGAAVNGNNPLSTNNDPLTRWKALNDLFDAKSIVKYSDPDETIDNMVISALEEIKPNPPQDCIAGRISLAQHRFSGIASSIDPSNVTPETWQEASGMANL